MGSSTLIILMFGICYSIDSQFTDEENQNLEYPCASTDDWDCIRDFLASTGQCQKTSNEDGVPLNMEDIYTYVPSQNVSIATTNTTVTMYGSKILNFYLNKDTSNLVMTFDFDALYLETPLAIFEFATEIGKEPAVVKEYANIKYPAVITAMIAWSDHIKVDDLRAFGYVKIPQPKFIIGPKVTESSNPVVKRAYDGIVQDLEVALKELWLTKAYYYTCVFLNQRLCDFGYRYNGRVNRA